MMNQYLKRIITAVCTLSMLLTIAAPVLAIEDVADVPALGTSATEISIEAIAPAAAESALPIAELQDEQTTKAKISVETVEVKSKLEADSKKEVDVKLSISDNTGITGAVLEVNYADGMTLKAITRGDALSTLAFTTPGQFASPDSTNPDDAEIEFTPEETVQKPIKLVWDGVSLELDKSNGVLATLTFEISTEAEKTFDVTVTAVAGDIFEGSNPNGTTLENVEVDFVNGGITVVEQKYISGDVNDDGRINMQDKTFLARHIAKWAGYDETTMNLLAADVNEDGRVNMQDKTILARYIAKWNGYETLPYKN